MKMMQWTLLVLVLILSSALGKLVPETAVRPVIKGYTAISGICDPSAGVLRGQNYSGLTGTLRACSRRCDNLDNCQGLNFATDLQQCQLFERICAKTRALAKSQPKQNFYRKGEIECSMSTVGNEFYVAFMANRVAQPQNMSLEIWLTQDQSPDDITVTVEIHPSMAFSMLAPWQAGSDTFEMTLSHRNKTKMLYLLIPYTWKVSDIMDKDGNSGSGVSIEKKALRLRSDSNFVLYGVNKEMFTSDAFLGIPRRALGSNYVVVCHWPPFYNCEFAITSTADNTVISVTLPKAGAKNVDSPGSAWELPPMKTLQGNNLPPIEKCNVSYNGRTYTNGETFSFVLNEFDVAQIQDPCDLTGSVITSDKPIAVWSGNSRSNIGDSPTRDHLVEQLFSTDKWGNDCAAWPTPNRTSDHMDYWIITAAKDRTVVKIDSSERASFSYSLNTGESVRFPALTSTEWMRFTSDKAHPFQAVQLCHSTKDEKIPGDPSMTICIPSDQFGFGYTFVTPTGVSSTYTNYLTMITDRENRNGFQLDGIDLVDLKWNNIPNSSLVGGFVALDTSQRQNFRIEHKKEGVTFEAYIYGAGNRESIAYPTGACVKALTECRPTPMFIGDGKDNDCDGVIDEEPCDGIDNEFDGLIDEDCYARNPPLPNERCPSAVHVTACFDDQLQLACNDDSKITVVEAHFGRLGRAGEQTCGENSFDSSCRSSSAEENCGFVDAAGVVAAHCDGQQNCSIAVNYFTFGNLFAPSRCPSCSLYADAHFICLNQREDRRASVLSGSNYAASSWLSVLGVDYTSPADGLFVHSSCSANVENEMLDIYHPSQASFTASSARGWRPAPCDKNTSWLQVDTGGQYSIGWYAISGCRKEDYWVTKFKISYSQDGLNWLSILDNDGAPRKFDGNVDAINVKVCTLFAYNITARWLRIWPVAYNAYPCAHIDFGHAATPQICKVPPVANSNFVHGGTADLGSTITVKCSRGWAIDGGALNYRVHCGADGQWSGNFPCCCTLLFCQDIPQVENGYVIAKNNFPGSTVIFGCHNGLQLVGASSVTCQADGHWSDQPPTCEHREIRATQQGLVDGRAWKSVRGPNDFE